VLKIKSLGIALKWELEKVVHNIGNPEWYMPKTTQTNQNSAANPK
jgi:hypothetical protein